jgi:hypothetical protein
MHRHIREIAKEEGVSINQFISSAVTEKVSSLLSETYLQERSRRADTAKFHKILKSVPDRPPLPGDEL